MANPTFLSSTKLPMTLKPTMSSVGANRPTYDDIFNIQNTIRILLAKFVEEAPIDGEAYERKDGGWVLAGDSVSIPWGNITGNIADQTDLATALAAKLSDAPSDGITYGRNNGAWVAAGGGGGGSNSDRVGGYTYALPGYIYTSIAPSVTSATDSVRCFFFNASNLPGNKLKVIAGPAFSGRLRAAVYSFNPVTGVAGALIQDLGEVVITPAGSVDRDFLFPVTVGPISTYCLVALFFSVVSTNYLRYLSVTGKAPEWTAPLTPAGAVNVIFRYDGTLTYPLAAAPASLPALTGVATYPITTPLFIAQS